MKIATFNVNGITARLPRLLEWLAESAPDVACLQELKTSDETFPVDALRDAGYSAIWHGQKGFNGVAVLSRLPFDEVTIGLAGDEADVQSRFKAVSRFGQPLSIMLYGEEIEALEQLTGEAVSESGDTFVFSGPETGPSTSPQLCVPDVGAPGVTSSTAASPYGPQ